MRDGWPPVGQPDPEAAPDAPKDPGWEVDVKSFPRPSVLVAWRHRSSEAGNRQRKLDQYMPGSLVKTKSSLVAAPSPTTTCLGDPGGESVQCFDRCNFDQVLGR